MIKTLYPLYHGTREEHGLSILDGFHDPDQQAFIIKNEREHAQWLGDGVYFWEDSLEKANWWSSTIKKEKNPFVLIAKVKVEYDSFLNLDLSESQREFEQFIEEVRVALIDNSLDLVDPSMGEDEVDAGFSKLVQAYATSKNKKVIKKTFENKSIHNPLRGKVKVDFPEMSVYYTDTQICVYDQNTIVSLDPVV